MSKRAKWVIAVLTVMVLLLVAAFIRQTTRPLEQQILAAKHIEFMGEAFAADGGSFAFFFRLPDHQPLALLVRNRLEGMGNPDFQEIWLDHNLIFTSHIDLEPGSELESKLIALLRAATVNANTSERFSFPPQSPRPERLSWVIERIQDRKTKW